MGSVVLDISMSLDGFVTTPDDAPGRGLGTGGEVLHNWVFGGPWSYDQAPDPTATGVDREVLDEAVGTDVSVVGRRTYDIVDGWGGSPPGGGTCIVVTHRVEDQPDPSTGFVFVDGVEPALARARELAGDGTIVIGGGASVAQQALQAGLVDELSIHVDPGAPRRRPHAVRHPGHPRAPRADPGPGFAQRHPSALPRHALTIAHAVALSRRRPAPGRRCRASSCRAWP